MECLASMVTEIIMKIGNCLWVPVKRQTSYVIHYKSNVKNVSDQVKKLEPMRDDVQGLVNLARDEGKVIKHVVEDWQKRVNDIEGKVRRLDDEVNENKRCFSGWCPSLSLCYRIGKEAKKIMLDLDALQNEGKFSVVADPAPHPGIESIPTGDFVDSESTKSAMKQVIDALKDENINIVGVYGLGGVGKTTLMKQVGKQMKRENLYNEVVMVTVSQNFDLQKIICEIGEKLGLTKLREEPESHRAGRLCERLKQEKRVLLILDDLWEQLELFEIGIPLANEHKGCKIVLTSRRRDVCTQMMSQVMIEVQVLSDRDSWVLFKRNTGDFIESPEFRTVANAVVEECRGLPIAIVIIGRALRGKDLSYWEDSLEQLRRSEMNEKLFKTLIISYHALESEEKKLCFLFCCLFPEDCNISMEALMLYWFGEGFQEGVFTLEDARRKVRIMVKDLKDSCLLLEGDRKETIKMHDVLRDLAIKFSSERERKFLVKAGQGLKNWPEREVSEKCTRISLMDNEISMLSGRPNCPELQTLLLSNNESLKEIQNDFFEGMTNLVVLDLSGSEISSLPSSFSSLINLRMLCLDDCTLLTDLSPLGRLNKLEILRLNGSRIRQLPEEIGELANLKLLDLTRTTVLIIVPANVISKLTRLEELYMSDSFDKWELIGQGHGGNASIAEVTSSSYLTVLNIDIENIEIFSKDISGPWRNLRKFCIRVDFPYLPHEGERCMCLRVSGPFANWVKDLAERTEYLSLDGSVEKVETLFSKNPNGPPQSGMLNLRVLRVSTSDKLVTLLPTSLQQRVHNLENIDVSYCDELQEVFNSEENGEEGDATLTKLTELSLTHLNILTTIWKGYIPLGSLQSLKKLQVRNCDKLVRLLPTDLLQRLHNLASIEVSFCAELQEVFNSEENGEEGDATLTKLTELSLRDLNILTTIWKGHIPLGSLQSLKTLEVWECNKLVRLLPTDLLQRLHNLASIDVYYCAELQEVFNSEENGEEGDATLTKLPELSLQRLNNLTTIWKGYIPLGSLQSLNKLQVRDCDKLVRLLPTDLLQRLHNLASIDVYDCAELQEVFNSEENGEEGDATLTKLTELTLRDLNILTTIWKGYIPLGSLQSLNKLTVRNCSSLKYLLSPSLGQKIQQLKYLDVILCEKMEGLISMEEEEREVTEGIVSSILIEPDTRNSINLLPPLSTFQNLKTLHIRSCNSLKYIFSWEVACGLKQLQALYLQNCDRMELLIAEKAAVGLVSSCVLPQLKNLVLKNLPRLEKFCHGDGFLDLPCLEVITVADCGNLKRLHLGPQSTQKLRKIKAEKGWFEELEWGEETTTKLRLQRLLED